MEKRITSTRRAAIRKKVEHATALIVDACPIGKLKPTLAKFLSQTIEKNIILEAENKDLKESLKVNEKIFANLNETIRMLKQQSSERVD